MATAMSDRSLGWLRDLHRKATMPDDWSRTGGPHLHWDSRCDAPMASWHRFDVVDSSYALDEPARWTVEASDGLALATRVEGADLVVDTVVGDHADVVSRG